MTWVGLVVIVLGAAISGWGGTMVREHMRPALSVIFGGLVIAASGWVIAVWDVL